MCKATFKVTPIQDSQLFYYRFFEDLKDMLGFSPFRFYYYMWKYITPMVLLVLLIASMIQLGMTPPSYSAWIEELVSSGIHGIFRHETCDNESEN